MCGIAGMWGVGPLPISTLEDMSLELEHRGPDGHGYLLYKPGQRLASVPEMELAASEPILDVNVAFAHRRLSIIDLDRRSDQPMVDHQNGLALAYNGEVYNYVEIRSELEGMGYSFNTASDTEVILRAYHAWGISCLERFIGMWAFALLDVPHRRLVLSRDRFGIKPLYYARIPGGWAFGSEIKGMLRAGGLSPVPNSGVLCKYLTSGLTDDSDQSFFSGIQRVPAASNLIVEGGWGAEPTVSRYWSPALNDPPSNAVSGFRDLFTDSVRLHARSDAPVGSCLSGGIDSSTIVCVAEGLRRSGRIPAYVHRVFGYVPNEGEFSEERYMRDVADKTGAALTVIAPDQSEVERALQDAVRAQDEPFGSSSIVAQYLVFQAAEKAGVKVMLDGQGADELLAGYHSYFGVVAMIRLRQLRLIGFTRLCIAYRLRFGGWPVRAADIFSRFKVAVRLLSALAARAPRVASALNVRPESPRTVDVLTPLAHSEADQVTRRWLVPRSLGAFLWDQMTVVNLPSLLRFEDRNSMAHSVEARVPFLDHRLVEYAGSLPDEMLLNGVDTKYVLREALGDLLPHSVRFRKDKIGFRASRSITWDLAEVFRHELDHNIGDWEPLWFSPGSISRLLDSNDRSDAAENLLWRILNAKLWLRIHWPTV
jgi:asparagine synthase (glutamine-hydrolysing)